MGDAWQSSPNVSLVEEDVRCNGQPVCQISDTPCKASCSDPTLVAYLRQVFNKPE